MGKERVGNDKESDGGTESKGKREKWSIAPGTILHFVPCQGTAGVEKDLTSFASAKFQH